MIQESGDKAEIELLFHNKKLTADARLLKIYEYFSTPLSLDEAHLRYNIPFHILHYLVEQFLIIEQEKESCFSLGFLNKAAPAIGKPISWGELLCSQVQDYQSYIVLGIPVDIGAEFGGTRSGPSLIRQNIADEALLSKAVDIFHYETKKIINIKQLQVFDCGDITWNLGESLDSVALRAEQVYSMVFDKKFRCISLGGDHSISKFALKTLLKQEEIQVVHFDAHHDLYQPNHQHYIENHATVFCELLEDKNLLSLTQIGLRTLENFDNKAYRNSNSRLHCISSLEVYNKDYMRHLAHLDPSVPLYISFDIDCLAFPVFHETGTPIVGGLHYYDALNILIYLFQHHQVIGIDFVELRGGRQENMGLQYICQYIYQYFFHRCPSAPFAS